MEAVIEFFEDQNREFYFEGVNNFNCIDAVGDYIEKQDH
jgi:hypothetical protein